MYASILTFINTFSRGQTMTLAAPFESQGCSFSS